MTSHSAGVPTTMPELPDEVIDLPQFYKEVPDAYVIRSLYQFRGSHF